MKELYATLIVRIRQEIENNMRRIGMNQENDQENSQTSNILMNSDYALLFL